MVRRMLPAVATAFALVMGCLIPPAAAQSVQCYVPDDEGPIIHNFDVRPAALPRGSDPFELLAFFSGTQPQLVGARVSADVWDLPNQDPNNQHNVITRALLEIPEADLVEDMHPLPDGRWVRVRQPVEFVLPPDALVPGEVYTLRITGQDACGNTTAREWTIRQVTFLVTVICDNAPRDTC